MDLQTNSAYAPVQEDLDRVDENLISLAETNSPWLAAPLAHILDKRGKRLRPALTLLAGKCHSYNFDLLLPMSSAVELLHTASLVHDDTVDGSTIRRGKATVSALWGKNTAVLVGDYLFANAAELVSRTRNVDVMRLFAQTLMIMANSELNESASIFDVNQTREQYYERIGGKTASLFSMAVESGARLSRAPQKNIEGLRDYGYFLGIAFQIVDDILDFIGKEDEVGKPVGADLSQGILTLPTIIILERSPDNSAIRSMIKRKNPEHELERAIQTIRGSSVINECEAIAKDFSARACSALQTLHESDAKQALIDLAEHALDRKS